VLKTHSQKYHDDVAKLTGKKRVYATYWPERIGTLLDKGEKYSMIRWDNGVTADTFVLNRLLVTVKPRERLKLNKPKREKIL
jgi:hypothetical protein